MHSKDDGMDLRLRTTLAQLAILIVAAGAVRLYPCDSSRYRDVEENTTVTFHCDQYSQPVEWKYRGKGRPTYTTISTCSDTRCTPGSPWSPAFISADNSSLTTNLTSRDLDFAGGEYNCDNQTCRMHIIVPAYVSIPTRSITQTDLGYSLHCSTAITMVYSSKGQYSCSWQIGTLQVNGTLELQPPPDDTNNTSERMGTCNVTLQLSNITDDICNVTVLPGNTFASSDMNTDAQNAESSYGLVIGGTIGGVAALVCCVVAGVCVIKRKKKGVHKSASDNPRNVNRTTREEDPDYDVDIVNACYESSESTFGQVQGNHYEYIDNRLSMNPTLQVASYAQSPKYAEKENISDQYASVRRDR